MPWPIPGCDNPMLGEELHCLFAALIDVGHFALAGFC